jgi:lipoate-protein ligase A
MESVTTLRLIHDPPGAGDWNMAVDEMMLETAASSGQGVLRFYSWNEPTLSLGYFQAIEERQSHSPSLYCPVVRRSTGGGAIVHDRELTYSVALPLSDRWSRRATALYDLFHGSLVAALSSRGLTACLQDRTLESLQSNFLCFQRRSQGDVIVDDCKIAGSAQRRKRGSLLQHGSVLLAASKSAPDVLGLRELSCEVSADTLARAWTRGLEGRWSQVSVVAGDWTSDEITLAGEILGMRFANPTWQTRRAVTNCSR